MITHSRPLTPLEHLYIHIIPCNIQLAIKVEDSSVIPEYIKRIKQTSLALRLRADDNNLYRTTEDSPVLKIPENITDMKSAIEYSLLNCQPQKTFPLANIAHNSNMIVFHSIHTFCDGAMLMRIVEEIQHPTNPRMPESLPTPVLITLKDTLDKLPTLSHDFRDPICTHFKNTIPKVEDKTDIFQNIVGKYPVSTMKCYNNNTGKVEGLTEFMGASLVLATKAINDIGDGYGLQCAINLRPYLPEHRRRDLDIVDHVSNFIMNSKNPRTVGEMCNDFVQCKKYALKNKTFLSHTKWDVEHYVNGNDEVQLPNIGLANSISHVGQVRIKRPIKDIMMRVDMEDPYEFICVVAYSVISETENTFRSHLNYGRVATTKRDMQRLNDAYGFVLQNVGKDTPIKEAISMIKQFDRRNK